MDRYEKMSVKHITQSFSIADFQTTSVFFFRLKRVLEVLERVKQNHEKFTKPSGSCTQSLGLSSEFHSLSGRVPAS